MKELLFKNYVFEDGLNLTIRRGNRKKKFKFEDKVCLKTVDRKEKREATIVYISTGVFHEIKAHEIQFEHDPNCRIYEGLLCVMKEVYPGFHEFEEVTLIFFKLNENL